MMLFYSSDQHQSERIILYRLNSYQLIKINFLPQKMNKISQNYQGVASLDVQKVAIKTSNTDKQVVAVPSNKLHFLAFALQKGVSMPSLWAMERTQRKNHMKSGQDRATQIVGRRGINPFSAIQRRAMMMKMRIKTSWAGPFVLPPKYENKVVTAKNPVQKTARKAVHKAFKLASPANIVLKMARTIWIEKIKNYRKQSKVAQPVTVPRKVPQYFRKKKANQKRRRQEKHKLIVAHKQQLLKIFGKVIFQTGWPISRKQIRQALGLKETDHYMKGLPGVKSLIRQKRECYEVKPAKITKTQAPLQFKDSDFPSLL